MNNLRRLIAYLMSLSLVYQPGFAQGFPVGSVKLREIAKKYSEQIDSLPSESQKQLKDLIQAVGDKAVTVEIKGQRMVIQSNKQSVVVDLVDDGSILARINGVNFTYGDFYLIKPALEKLEQMMDNNNRGPASLRITGVKAIPFGELVVPSLVTWNRLNLTKRKQYMIHLRELYDQMAKIQSLQEAKLGSSAWFFDLLVNRAYAGGTPELGSSCLVAGYLSEYGMSKKGSLSCGINEKGEYREGISKQIAACHDGGNSISCNLFLFGNDRQSGKALCVPLSEIAVASTSCAKKSPVKSEAEQIALVNSMSTKLLGKKNISPEDWQEYEKILKDMEVQLKSVGQYCGFETDRVTGKSEVGIKTKFFKKSSLLKDQQQACQSIAERSVILRNGVCNAFIAEKDKPSECQDDKNKLVAPIVLSTAAAAATSTSPSSKSATKADDDKDKDKALAPASIQNNSRSWLPLAVVGLALLYGLKNRKTGKKSSKSFNPVATQENPNPYSGSAPKATGVQ